MSIEQIQDDLDSAYGDGWYDGFLAAKKISTNDESFESIDDYSSDDVLHLSEHAELERPSNKRKRWTKEPPIKQGLYWHWSGCNDDAPIVLSILYSGTKKECFVSIGQYGITNAVYCNEYGGWWADCTQPELPET